MPQQAETMIAGKEQKWGVERRGSRYRIDVRLRMVRSRNGVQEFISGRGTDVSEGGLAAYIPADLNAGERIQLEITLPYCAQPLQATATVRNKSGFRYGLEFQPLSK